MQIHLKAVPETAPYRYLFSAGGTGGHIFPALAVANKIREIQPDSEFLFIGAKGKLEMKKVPEAGFEIKGLRISGIERSNLLKNLLWPFKLAGSLISALSVIRKFKPHVAAGFGGFASGPALYASSLLGIPCLIQEQNSYAGITNRLLGGKAQVICTAYEGMEKFFPGEKIFVLGNPVRQEILDQKTSKEESKDHFKIPREKPAVLVFGGSQGALGINKGVESNIEKIGQRDYQMIWQTGQAFFPTAKKAVENAGANNIKVFPFINEMDKAYAASDLVVCRSGAISISELAVIGKPALFVPLPTAAEDHQTKNAMALAEKGAARVIENQQVSENLMDEMDELFRGEGMRSSMSEAMKSFGKPLATQSIAQKVIELAA